jgi:hypothetical protein
VSSAEVTNTTPVKSDREAPRPGGEPTRLERWTAPWRALPNLLVIGAQKSGTTSLHDFLARHPEIRMSRIKECHVLWKTGCSLRNYRAFFPLRARCRADRVKHVGESTPFYLFHPEAAANAQRLAQAVAAESHPLKAIAVLRDPVERAWSHYQHAIRQGTETHTFSTALDLEQTRVQLDTFSLQHHTYQSRGLYAEQLERWFAVLGREQVLVLEFRELLAMQPQTRERLREFLGVSQMFEGDFPAANRGDSQRIPTEMRERLAQFYAEPNRRLERLLGFKFSWTLPDTSNAVHPSSPDVNGQNRSDR